MPNPNTFQMGPCQEVLTRYIAKHRLAKWDGMALGNGDLIVVDPFARTSQWASVSNDLNPEYPADFHMEARDFLRHLLTLGFQNKADVVLLDPPYSPRQVAECYSSLGVQRKGIEDPQTSRLYSECKDLLDQMLKPEGVAICFGWNSSGFGDTRHYQMIEILLLRHGGPHYDTIITVEVKSPTRPVLLPTREVELANTSDLMDLFGG